MNKQQRKNSILAKAQKQKSFSIQNIIQTIPVNRTTLFRDIQELIQEKKIETIQKGLYRMSKTNNIDQYFATPFYERKNISYNFDFIRDYKPNTSNFFTAQQQQSLQKIVSKMHINTLFYKQNTRLLENALIDLSFASSQLEGNTYTYLDTEILIKHHQASKARNKDETTMILNHKYALEYLLHNYKKLSINKKTLCQTQSILAKDLLQKEYIGTIRKFPVEIGGSSYKPLDNEHQINQELDILCKKANRITNPFEQSIFLAIFIPYFQSFVDINKRTSRLLLNLPLIKHNLPIVSLMQIDKKEYINAILSIYELHNPSLLAELYVDNVEKNTHRYVHMQ